MFSRSRVQLANVRVNTRNKSSTAFQKVVNDILKGESSHKHKVYKLSREQLKYVLDLNYEFNGKYTDNNLRRWEEKLENIPYFMPIIFSFLPMGYGIMIINIGLITIRDGFYPMSFGTLIEIPLGVVLGTMGLIMTKFGIALCTRNVYDMLYDTPEKLMNEFYEKYNQEIKAAIDRYDERA